MTRPWKVSWSMLIFTLLLGVLAFGLSTNTASAANPTTMSFQGKMVNADGTNVANGTYSFVFKLYTVSSSGSAIWTETQSSVTVTSGTFQVNLGSVCPFFTANACNGNTPIDFNTNSALYLGITFNGDPAGEMSPRVQLQSVPFAYNSDRVGGFTASQLVQLSPGSQQSGSVNVSGNITSAATVQGATLTATGALQGNSLSINGGVLAVTNGGVVTGGTYNSQTISSTASFTGTVAVATSLSTPIVTSSSSLSVVAGGTAQNLTLNGSTSGTVSIGGVSTGNIDLGGGTAGGSGCTVSNSTGDFACNGSLTGTNGLKSGSTTVAGSIVLNDGTANARAVTINTPALTSSYSLTLPGTGPVTSQCLQTDSVTASQLVFGDCAAIGQKLTQTFNTYASNQAASATTAMNYLVPTSTTAFSVAVSGATEFKATSAGSFRACSLMSSAAVTAGTVSVRFRKNGANVSSNNYCTLSTANTRSNSEIVATGVETFAAGDTIGIALVSSTLAPTTNEHSATFTIEYGAGGVGVTSLQDAYTNGSSVTTVNAADLAFNLANTATDANFLVNIATGSGGKFAVQNNGSDVLSINSSGALTVSSSVSAPTLNATTALQLSGANINTAGTLTNVAYLNQVNNFSADQTISANNGKNTLSLTSTGTDTGITFGADTNIYRSGASLLKTDDAFTAVGLITAQAGLTIDAGQTVTVNGDALTDLTGDGLQVSSGTLTVSLTGASDGLSSTTTSGSGLEVLGSGLTLLQGCSDGQILKWNETTDVWYCASDAGGGGVAANSLDFADLKDGLTLDAPTSIAFGASNYGLTFTNNGTGNATFNLTSTGDFVVQSNGTDALTVNESGELVLGEGSVATGKLVFSNDTNSNTATIQAGATSSNYTWTLPTADSAGCLASDGSGTLTIAACGDTEVQTFTSSSNYTVPENALMVIVEAWGGGGGGGGGTGGSTAAVRNGGAGGGGGAYATTIITGATLGTAGSVVPVTVGTGGNGGGAASDGSPGGTSCLSTTTNCAGSIFVQAFGGGGGNGNGTAGNGGGGGGGNQSVGTTNGTAATGGTGGGPLGAAAGAQNSGFGGAGGATAAATGAAGGSGSYGGGGGGSSSSTGAGNSGAGGGAIQGGAAGGAGGSCAITTCTQRSGGAGGHVPGASGGGGTAGVGAGVSGGVGADGVGSGGDGGGGGANTPTNGGTGGNGGIGGARGGGGGGGGASAGTGTQTPGNGGTGGTGYLRTWTLRGSGADLAELYCSVDELAPGTTVAIDSSIQNGVKKTAKAYDANSIGVISTHPGLIMGDACSGNAKPALVALAGRIPIKVSSENGQIKPGDLLTPSSIPGVAMKATKAGNIIGQSMTAYASDGPEYVVGFIKNSHSNGSSLSELIPGLSDGTSSSNTVAEDQTVEQKTLAYFASSKAHLEQSADLSEILADRVSAGLEIITPKVATNELQTDTIAASTGADVIVQLADDGHFKLVNKAGQTIATFDAIGNAQFSGTITAQKLKVGQIEGLDGTNQATSSSQPVPDSPDSPATQNSTPGLTGVQNAEFKDTQVVNLVALAQIESKGGLIVDKDAQFNGKTIFQMLADFNGDANFHSNVTFDKQPIFNNNAGGTAVIKQGAQKVAVSFTNPYQSIPIVTANWALGSDDPTQTALFDAKYDYYVSKTNQNGFVILLNKPAEQELRLNWTASAVKDAKISESDQ